MFWKTFPPNFPSLKLFTFIKNLDCLPQRQKYNSLADGANHSFCSVEKMPNFNFHETYKLNMGGKNTQRPLAARKLLGIKATLVLLYCRYSLSLAGIFGKMIFHTKISSCFLLKQPLKSTSLWPRLWDGFCLDSTVWGFWHEFLSLMYRHHTRQAHVRGCL